ncbi:hypothetical protein ABIB40_001793 [Pedobacter sp. UYP30]|uniref:hypothetical protein n=1 Tax=Pedobacter sp. UYP30 TaxID=1756400 RepID=UPI003394999D
MSNKAKKIFLALTVIVPFIIYCVAYYIPIFRNAPFRLNDFVSVQYSWGVNDSLENHYNSVTGEYQYINSRDSMVRKKVLLNHDNIIYLHSKARELGLWNFPDTLGEKSPTSKQIPRYVIVFNYKEKSKRVVIYANFDGNPKLVGAAVGVRKAIEETINMAERRSGK